VAGRWRKACENLGKLHKKMDGEGGRLEGEAGRWKMMTRSGQGGIEHVLGGKEGFVF